MATTTAQIQQLYVAYLGRAADKAGLDYWSAELNAEPAVLTLEDLRANFVNEQPEYAAIYGGLTREDTVVQIYNNLFGRAPDAAGLTYWTTGGGASVNADQLLTAFINGASATDSQTITNKVLVAEIYTAAAGDNFLAADAATIISGVTDNASIGSALDLLTNGSLSGIAVPAAISALKADIVADAAVVSFETNNAATLKALHAELVKLSTTDDTASLIGNVPASTATSYADLKTAIDAAIVIARGSLDTEALTATLATDTKALATARTELLTSVTGATKLINDYDAAFKADASTQVANVNDANQAKAALGLYATNTNNTATFAAAVKAAGLPDAATAADVYAALASGTATDAQINQITTAFAGINEFAAVKTLAAQDHADAAAALALAAATGALTASPAGATYQGAYDTVADDTAALNASKAVDAFEAKYNVTDTAHTSLVSAAAATQAAVDDNAAVVAVDVVAAGNVTAGTGNSDVFHFVNKVDAANDVTVTFNAKDSLFLGEGYTLNSAATVDATTGFITGGDNNKLEVFFVQKGADVQAVIETSVTGSTTADLSAAAAADGAAVITLTGVTVAELTFANGVISHVA